MTTLTDALKTRMSDAAAADLREMNERIAAIEALLSGLKRAREDLLDSIRRRHAAAPLHTVDPVLRASIDDCLEDARLEAAHLQRLAEVATEPGVDYWE